MRVRLRGVTVWPEQGTEGALPPTLTTVGPIRSTLARPGQQTQEEGLGSGVSLIVGAQGEPYCFCERKLVNVNLRRVPHLDHVCLVPFNNFFVVGQTARTPRTGEFLEE